VEDEVELGWVTISGKGKVTSGHWGHRANPSVTVGVRDGLVELVPCMLGDGAWRESWFGNGAAGSREPCVARPLESSARRTRLT
jgi:hypothetical protein